MPINFNAGISGVTTARRVMEVIGHNIANVNTKGYSRQEAHLANLSPLDIHGVNIGQGVRLDDVRSVRDKLVEDRLRLNESSLAGLGISRELAGQIEEQFNDPTEGGINALLARLYNNFEAVSVRPQDTSVRLQLLNDAKRLTSRVQQLDQGLIDLTKRIPEEIGGRVGRVNQLLGRIADVNKKILWSEKSGKPANDFIDESNKLLTELSKLVKVEVTEDEFHVRKVTLGGELLVSGDKASTVAPSDSRPDALTIFCDKRVHEVTPADGEIGALLRFRTEVIPGLRDDLDQFAKGLIRVVNGIHSEGMGLDGRFTSLLSENAVADTNQDGDRTNDILFNNAGLGVAPKAGFLHLTVANENANPPTFTRHEIAIEPTKDTLATIAAKINALDGMNASADPVTGKLKISSEPGFSFDFSKPTELGNLVSTDPNSPKVTLSGEFTGQGTDNYTFSVVSASPGQGKVSPEIGRGTVTVEVKDQAGAVLKTLNLGAGYIPGQAISIGNGLSVSFGPGTVNPANSISTPIYSADTDTADLLASLGINSFFSGSGAGDIRVSDRVMIDPRSIAHALSATPGDAENALRISGLFDATPEVPELDTGTTLAGDFQNLVQSVGQRSQELELREETQRKATETLQGLRDSISGVSIDEEVANLLRFQQAYQASARFITAMNQVTQLLYNL